MTNGRRDDMSDEALIEALVALVDRLEPVPDDWVGAAQALFCWRTVDAELAALVEDSRELAGVRARGDHGRRRLTFEAPLFDIELELSERPARRLIGQLVPPQRMHMELHSMSGSVSVQSDASGRFAFPSLAPGPFRLRCVVGDDQPAVETTWVSGA